MRGIPRRPPKPFLDTGDPRNLGDMLSFTWKRCSCALYAHPGQLLQITSRRRHVSRSASFSGRGPSSIIVRILLQHQNITISIGVNVGNSMEIDRHAERGARPSPMSLGSTGPQRQEARVLTHEQTEDRGVRERDRGFVVSAPPSWVESRIFCPSRAPMAGREETQNTFEPRFAQHVSNV